MDAEPNDKSASRRGVGATTDLPHDRMTVARFREAFPRARWSDRLNAWFVPGRTAERRIGRWLAEMEAEADRFADEKGRARQDERDRVWWLPTLDELRTARRDAKSRRRARERREEGSSGERTADRT